MVQCSEHVIPPVVRVDLTDRQAHDLDLGVLPTDLVDAENPQMK